MAQPVRRCLYRRRTAAVKWTRPLVSRRGTTPASVRQAVYLPRSCRRARSVHFALADPIESPAARESGLLIPRRRGPLRFTGPVQNHVELVRRRAFIAPDHEEPLAVRRGRVVQEAVIVQEEGGPIKKPARRSEGTVRMEID